MLLLPRLSIFFVPLMKCTNVSDIYLDNKLCVALQVTATLWQKRPKIGQDKGKEKKKLPLVGVL